LALPRLGLFAYGRLLFGTLGLFMLRVLPLIVLLSRAHGLVRYVRGVPVLVP
jgi:ABC-type amino acid transport system permease subunit